MANKLALVLVGSSSPTEGSLQLESGETIEVGSIAWFDWLDLNPSFRFESGFAGEDSFTARKHERDSGEFWYAYRKLDKVVRSLYLGKSRRLDVERLLEAASKLKATPTPKAEGYTQKCITLPHQLDDPTDPTVEGTSVAGAQQHPAVSELQAEVSQLREQLMSAEAENAAIRSEKEDWANLCEEIVEAEKDAKLNHQNFIATAKKWFYELQECKQRLQERPSQQPPDLDDIRDRVLGGLRLGKQAPEYKRTKAAIDKFIAELRSPGS